jgi:quercetin dioxygenase-like cupin family protein
MEEETMTVTRPSILSTEALSASVAAIKARKGDPPWGEPLFVNDDMQVYIICQAPGHQNDTHYHEHDELWAILEGELSWHYEFDPTPHIVRAGDFIWAPKGQWHHIEVLGDSPAIRVAFGVQGEYHRYDRPGCHPAPKP